MIEMVHEKTGKSHLTEEDSLMVTHHEKMLGTTRPRKMQVQATRSGHGAPVKVAS